MAHFGPAGNSPSFYLDGGKSSVQVPGWLKKLKLDAYEYQASRGVHIKEEQAGILGAEAQRNGVVISIHAPYYINLASLDPKIIASTEQHLLKSLQAAKWMGATTVVFHPGSGSGNRQEAMLRAHQVLDKVLILAEERELTGARLAPETMGKRNSLGSLEEVIEFCTQHQHVVPCVDFAHLHALAGGGLTTAADFHQVLELIGDRLGQDGLKNLHIHFSPIEFTAGGEKRHRTLEDEGFGPDFRVLAQVMTSYGMEPTVICESFDRQAEDALVFQTWWKELT